MSSLALKLFHFRNTSHTEEFQSNWIVVASSLEMAKKFAPTEPYPFDSGPRSVQRTENGSFCCSDLKCCNNENQGGHDVEYYAWSENMEVKEIGTVTDASLKEGDIVCASYYGRI